MNKKRVYSYEAMEEELRYLNGVIDRAQEMGIDKTGAWINVVVGEDRGHVCWDITSSLYN